MIDYLKDILQYDPQSPMLFNSGLFWVLFCLFLPLYAVLRRRKVMMMVYVVAFSYPVVPKDRARIRTQVSAAHSKDDLDFAVRCFAEVKKEMGI